MCGTGVISTAKFINYTVYPDNHVRDKVIKKAANMSKKAIVVDNDFFFVEFLSELLQARGYQVIRTYDGKEAKSKLEQQSFDLIFVDMVMPKMDGRELIRFVRSTFPDVHFPIIALSGIIVEQLDKLDEMGADYFITKGPMEKMAKYIEMLMDKIEE
ncbi:MAG: response regulator [Deltaproteobacteria bacterium]|nr:response regulator [Deltaproteobacteria bacterium]